MKNQLKLLSTSLIVALSFASSQASYAMKEDDQDKNNLTISQTKQVPWKEEIPWTGYDDKNKKQISNVGEFSKLPKPLVKKILNMAIYQQAIDDGEYPINIELICKVFRHILATDTEKFNKEEAFAFNTRSAFLEGLKVHYNITTQEQIEVFNKFYKGELIYKPDPNSDNGKIELLISGLKHPLKGEFGLSKCGGTEEDLSINMGYRKGKNSKNAKKVEIWFAPRFLIAKDLDTTASHFKPIMDDWKPEQGPLGIFFTWGGRDKLAWYDYLTTESMDELSEGNLFQKYKKSDHTRRQDLVGRSIFGRRGVKCTSHFVCELK